MRARWRKLQRALAGVPAPSDILVAIMFVVAESVEGNVWGGLRGIFGTEEAARRFQESLTGEDTDCQVFPVLEPAAYPFLLTGEGLELGSVRPIGETELERLLASVDSSGPEDEILFNVYSVLGDSFNRAFPGEHLLPKLPHYHVMATHHDSQEIRDYLLTDWSGSR